MIKKNLQSISNSVTDSYKNFEVAACNQNSLRMSVNNGLYDWHIHSNADELFIGLEGILFIDVDVNTTFTLRPFDYLKIPKGVLHRTRSTKRTVNLTFEKKLAKTQFLAFDSSKINKRIDNGSKNLLRLAQENKDHRIPLTYIDNYEFILRTVVDIQENLSVFDELIIGIEGNGKIKSDSNDHTVSKGEMIQIPSGTFYEMVVPDQLIFASFQKKV